MKYFDFLKNSTCTVLRGDEVIYSSGFTGIRPVLDIIHSGTDITGCTAVDKIVGKAAALLYVYAGVSCVYAEVMSYEGKRLLKENNIDTHFLNLTEKIINRRGDGICPMEETVLEIDDPSTALTALETKVKELKANERKN